MQHLEGSGTPVLYIGLTVLGGYRAFIEKNYRKQRCALVLPITGQSFTRNCPSKTSIHGVGQLDPCPCTKCNYQSYPVTRTRQGRGTATKQCTLRIKIKETIRYNQLTLF